MPDIVFFLGNTLAAALLVSSGYYGAATFAALCSLAQLGFLLMDRRK